MEVIYIDLLPKCVRREIATVILKIRRRLAGSHLQYRIFSQELVIHQRSHKKFVSITKLPQAVGLIVTILSQFTAGLGISGQFLSILWVSSYIIRVLLTYRREQETIFKKSFIYATFSHNLGAAHTFFFLLPRIWQIWNKVLLSTVTAAYPRGASIADGMPHYPALFSPVCPCTSSSFMQNSVAEKQSYL